MVTNDDFQALQSQADELIDQGKLGEALKIFERACESRPDNAYAWMMRGAISGEVNGTDAAIAHLNRAIELDPGLARAHLTLGRVYRVLGMADRALECVRTAVATDAEDPDAYIELGNLLRTQNRNNEAIEAFSRATVLDPDFADAWNMLAWMYNGSGNVERARDAWQHYLVLKPDDAQALLGFGSALQQMREYSAAAKSFQRAIEIDPSLKDAHNAHGRALLANGQIDAAGRAFDAALKANPYSAEAHANKAAILQYQGQLHAARKELEEASRAQPENPVFAYRLSGVLAELGEFEGALEYCRKAASSAPGYDDAMTGQAEILRKMGRVAEAWDLIRPFVEGNSDNIQAMLVFSTLAAGLGMEAESQTRLERVSKLKGISAHDQALIHSELGKLYDKAGRYAEAFEQFKIANHNPPGRHDAGVQESVTTEIMQVLSETCLRELSRATTDSNRLVFIVGMPRSGTTLVGQILASHPEVTGIGERAGTRWLAGKLTEMAGAKTGYPHNIAGAGTGLNRTSQWALDRFAELAPDARIVVVSDREAFMYFGVIEALFPKARIVHCTRDPRDTCLSCYMTMMTANFAYTCDLQALGRYYRDYARIMAHWMKNSTLPFHQVAYEDLVNDLENTSRAMIGFCGLDWDPVCLNFHKTKPAENTASYSQVRKPIYKTSVGRWKHYESQLAPLIATLQGSVRTG